MHLIPHLNPLPDAVIFDLDDTLIAYDAVAEPCWQSVCRRFALRVPGLDANSLYLAIKDAREWHSSDPERHRSSRLNTHAYRREVATVALKRLGIDVASLANEIGDTYSVEREKAAYLLPGATRALESLRADGVKLALLTNGMSELQCPKISRFALAPYFQHIQIESEFGIGKPDERAFNNVLKSLDVTAMQTWMVGDNLEHDIGGAQKVGMTGIWVDWRGEGLPPSTKVKPHRIIHNVSAL